MTILSSIPSYLGGTTPAAAADPFLTGLNALGSQLVQLQAAVTARGAAASTDATIIAAYSSLVGQVQQYQSAYTQAGAAAANPVYVATLNDLNARLTAIYNGLKGTAVASTTVASTAPTDAFSSGLNALGSQIVQLQTAVAAAGPSARNNPTLVNSFTTLSTSLNAYVTSLRNAGAAAAGTPYQATVTDLTGRMAQIRAMFMASQPGVATTQPPTAYPNAGYPVQPGQPWQRPQPGQPWQGAQPGQPRQPGRPEWNGMRHGHGGHHGQGPMNPSGSPRMWQHGSVPGQRSFN